MRLKMKETISIVLVIIGALIGAGFASGQEIYFFFYSYGIKGIIGIVITCILMGILIYKSLKIIYENEINNYSEFLNRFIKNKKLNKIINIILNGLLLISFFIMIAGFGAYFQQEIGVSKTIGSIILVLLCAIVFFTSVRGVLKASEYIVPLLIIFIIIVGVRNIISMDLDSIQIPQIKRGWLLSAIIYCSYNLILLIPVLISLREQIKNGKNIKKIAIISGAIMLVVSVMIFMLIAKSEIDISQLEMPILFIIRTYFPKFKEIYAFIILASIFTTAISVGIGFLQNICKNKKNYTQIVLIMCITSLVISNFGFSKLVNLTYPIFGYLGIIQIILIIMAL